MKAQSVFQPRYLKAADLKDQTHLVHIERVHTRDDVLDPQAQAEVTRHVLYLLNGPKGFMLNITQTEAVVKATGQDDTDNWPGQSILLVPVTNSVGLPTIKVEPYDPTKDADQYAQFTAAAPRRLPTGADVTSARSHAWVPTVPPPHIGNRAPMPPAPARSGSSRSGKGRARQSAAAAAS